MRWIYERLVARFRTPPPHTGDAELCAGGGVYGGCVVALDPHARCFVMGLE